MILFHLMINNKQRKKNLTMQKLFGFANIYDENFTFYFGSKTSNSDNNRQVSKSIGWGGGFDGTTFTPKTRKTCVCVSRVSGNRI